MARDEEILNRFTVEPYEKLYQKYSLSGLTADQTIDILLSTSIIRNYEELEVAYILFAHKAFSKASNNVLKNILDKYSALKYKLQDIAILKGAYDKIKTKIYSVRELDYLDKFLNI